MNPLDAYMARSQEIIGERTSEEEKYDAEVLRWLRKGKKITKAIEAASRRFPEEALTIDDSNVDDVAAHYDYLLEHEKIMKRMKKATKRQAGGRR